MKKLVTILLVFTTFISFSQEEETTPESKWKKGGMASLTFNQVSLTNWAAGGQSSISGNVFFNLFANYKDEKQTWDNTLDLGYGLIRNNSQPFVKSDDRIELNSKYGRNINEDWYYSGLLNFRTQFAPGYNIPNDSVLISDFLAPGYILLAFGFDYKPSDNFTLMLSPVTSKTTIVNNQTLADAGAFGVEGAVYDALGNRTTAGKMIRNEVGAFLKMMYKKDIVENVNFQTKLDLFSNYLNNPQNIDINWETIVTMKINKFLSANLNTHLIYDDDIDIAVDNNDDGITDAVGPRAQFKEVFGLGVSFKF
jgi:hypothetical protein